MATSGTQSELRLTAFDEADFLKSEEDAIAYVQACLEETPLDGKLVAHALGVVARARNAMARIAEASGLSRESLYKALSGKRDPGLTTILKVLDALNLRMHVGPVARIAEVEVTQAPEVMRNEVRHEAHTSETFRIAFGNPPRGTASKGQRGTVVLLSPSVLGRSPQAPTISAKEFVLVSNHVSSPTVRAHQHRTGLDVTLRSNAHTELH